MDLQTCVNEILFDIRTIKDSEQVWLWIELHAETINKSRASLAFGMIQRMAYVDIFAALGRIFDRAGIHSIGQLGKATSSEILNENSCPQLKRIMDVRRKRVAHNLILKRKELEATFEDIDYCIDWAEKFILGLKSKASFTLPIPSLPSPLMSLRFLAHQANIVVDRNFETA